MSIVDLDSCCIVSLNVGENISHANAHGLSNKENRLVQDVKTMVIRPGARGRGRQAFDNDQWYH